MLAALPFMQPRHDEKFVLTDLCWLYARGEFAPPPPHASSPHALPRDILRLI